MIIKPFRVINILIGAAVILAMTGCGPTAQATEAPTQEPAADQPAAQKVEQQPTTVVLKPTVVPKIVQPTAVQNVLQPAGSYQGTVKPPGCNGVAISATGQYSMCGVSVATVTLKQDNVIVMLMPVDQTPDGAGRVLVASINLTVLVNNQISMGPHEPYATIKMCYAAPAGRSVVVRFYNPQTSTWTPLETIVQSGQACAMANFSGIYVLAEK